MRKRQLTLMTRKPDGKHDYLDARMRWSDLSQGLSLKGEQADIAAIREILPWYGMNALDPLSHALRAGAVQRGRMGNTRCVTGPS